MYSTHEINPARISGLLDLVKRNSEYLKSQGLYKDVIFGLEETLPILGRQNSDKSKE
jgi:hypothetical protein